MKISINSGDTNLFIPLPTSLACSGFVAKIAAKHTDGELSAEQLSRIFKELKKYRRRHGPLDFIEVDAADGTKIRISL